MSYMSASNKAFSLAYYEALGDADGINRENDQYMSVTEEEIVSVSERTFRPRNSSIIYYLPEKR
jgi:predicted Zn-dependent peptidase